MAVAGVVPLKATFGHSVVCPKVMWADIMSESGEGEGDEGAQLML